MSDKVVDAAKKIGCKHGAEKGKTLTQFGIDKELAQKIMDGYSSNDQQVMELYQSPLDGEWTLDPTHMAVLTEIAMSIEDTSSFVDVEFYNNSTDIFAVYESAYKDAFWEEIIKQCKEIVK